MHMYVHLKENVKLFFLGVKYHVSSCSSKEVFLAVMVSEGQSPCLTLC